MKLKPLNDTVIVRLDADRWQDIDKPKSIIIPDAVIGRYQKRANSGTIVSWGSKCKMPHKVGDKVFFKWIDHRPGDSDLRFLQEQELLAEILDV